MAEKILVIVESPTKSKTLSSFLPSNYKILASKGHITEIKDGGNYWNTGIDPENNFKTSFAISADKKATVEQLKKAVASVDKVILASDPDREGEAIAWSLKQVLKIPASKLYRATYTEVTKSAVQYALEHPRKIDDNLVDASHARMKLDKLLGYRLSPIARTSINAKSVGRCQSACLKLIVNREEEIQNFESTKYAELFLDFSVGSEDFSAKYLSDKRMSHDEIETVVKSCVCDENEGFRYHITNIESKQRLSNSRPPFTTSTFQQEASSKLGMSIETAMSCAQKLFEGIEINGQHVGLITYMRTDSDYMSEEFKANLKEFVIDVFGETYYAPVKAGKKIENSQEGHECLRITDLEMTPKRLSDYIDSENLLKVYTLIYKRTIASSMSSAITDETIYTISLCDKNFTMSSKVLRFDGYQKVYQYKDKSDDRTYNYAFKEDEDISQYSPKLDIVDKATQPPARYKEGTLQKELETQGIGRPSTWATIIKTVLDDSRGYCKIEDKCIMPTEKGVSLSHFLDDNFSDLINLKYTKEMEDSLDKIASGELSEIDFLTNFYNKMEDSVSKFSPNTNGTINCPDCGKPMRVRKGPYGSFWGCTGYPTCKKTIKIN